MYIGGGGGGGVGGRPHLTSFGQPKKENWDEVKSSPFSEEKIKSFGRLGTKKFNEEKKYSQKSLKNISQI